MCKVHACVLKAPLPSFDMWAIRLQFLPPSQADRETQHQDSLYRDWRRAQMVMSIVVGNIGIRNMFYHTNFGGEGCDHFRK